MALAAPSPFPHRPYHFKHIEGQVWLKSKAMSSQMNSYFIYQGPLNLYRITWGRIQDFQNRGGAKDFTNTKSLRPYGWSPAGPAKLRALESHRGFKCSLMLCEAYFEAFWYKTGYNKKKSAGTALRNLERQISVVCKTDIRTRDYIIVRLRFRVGKWRRGLGVNRVVYQEDWEHCVKGMFSTVQSCTIHSR